MMMSSTLVIASYWWQHWIFICYILSNNHHMTCFYQMSRQKWCQRSHHKVCPEWTSFPLYRLHCYFNHHSCLYYLISLIWKAVIGKMQCFEISMSLKMFGRDWYYCAEILFTFIFWYPGIHVSTHVSNHFFHTSLVSKYLYQPYQ